MPKKSHRIIHRRAKSHRRRTEPTAPHSILATLFGAAAGLWPFVSAPAGSIAPTQYLAAAADAAKYDNTVAMGDNLTAAGQSFETGLVMGALPMIGLAIAGVVVSWAGRKYGKSATNISRKWRVL